MQVNTRRQARISALSNCPAPSESDLTDIEDAKALVNPVLTTTVMPTDSRCTKSDSELSELSDDADAPLAAEQQSGLEETEEVDSEKETCEYSAYHGSDSEASISLDSSKKQSRGVKKNSKAIAITTEDGNRKSPPQSETEDDDLEIRNATTASGRAQIRALIDAHQMQVNAQMKAVEKARQALGAEEKLHRCLKRRLDRLKSSVAPFHRLPYELIGEITFLCVKAGGSPWELAKVCRSWRFACLSTSKLWGGLRVILYHNRPLSSRYHDGKENCVATDQLLQALVRSGATPLHLEFLQGRCSRKVATKRNETINQSVDILSYPEHMSRLKSLSLDSDLRWPSYPIPESFIRGPFPALEHISLRRSEALIRLTVNIANWAPRLNSAEFRGLWTANFRPKWVEQLRRLKIDGLRYVWCIRFHTFLASCSSLTSLSLTNVHSGASYSGTSYFGDIELFSLVNLEIRRSVVRELIFVTPVLETLVVEKTEWRCSKIKGDPDILQLRDFHWAGFQKNWMLGSVSAPAVDSLFIDMRNGGGWRLLETWRDDRLFEGTACLPQRLCVKHSGHSVPKDNVLDNGRFLRVFPGVRDVKIMGIPLGKGVLKELTKQIGPVDPEASVFHDGAPRKGGKQPPMCPGVEVLELDMTHVGNNVRRGMRTLMRAVLKARRLRSLRCLWDEGGEWEEFCERSLSTTD